MLSKKLQLKFYLERNGKPLELESFVPVFHDWIRRDALGELLIDVADYAHVQDGPGVVLIGHASDYFLDLGDGRPGLLYTRKRDASESGPERVAEAFRRALKACRLLEQAEPLAGHVRFRTDEVLVRVVDRASTANDDQNFNELRGELEATLAQLWAGASVRIEREGSPKELLTARVRAASAPTLDTLLNRAG
jgi:hypothetical protein